MRFVSPTQAVVLYDLADANGRWPDRIGGAKLVDGAWKVARATVCNDLTLGGVQCPP